jgi:GT2 family glycosyltransferase
MQRYYVIPSDFRLALDPATIVHGDLLLGGTPFGLVRLSGAQKAAVDRWRRGEEVGEDGALARALVHANLAHPVPPARHGDARGNMATDVDTPAYVAPHADTPGYAAPHADTPGYVAPHADTPGYVASHVDAHGYMAPHADTPRYAARHADTPGYVASHVDAHGYVATRGHVSADVTVVVPTRDRDVAALVAALGDTRVVVVDDGSRTPVADAAVRHATARGAAAARNAGAKLVATPLVAFLDSDTRPREGWLDALLPHFQDPRVALVAPRIVAARAGGWLRRYEARHSPLDRGPLPARVVPKGRVPFVPGAALVMRTELARFDETLTGGEDVDLVWRLDAQGHHVRYEPAAEVEHEHRTNPREWLARRAYYGRTAAPLAKRHPGHARPLHMSPWTAATYAALATRHPKTAATITAAAIALLARRLADARGEMRGDDAQGDARGDDARGDARGDDAQGDARGEMRGDDARGGTRGVDARGDARRDAASGGVRSPWIADARLAARLVAGGTLGARHLVADALVRQYWPLAALAAPRYLAAAALGKGPLRAVDAAAYGAGLWHGCANSRTLDPLVPDLTWRMVECDADILIELAGLG